MSYSVVTENGEVPVVRVGKNGQLVSGPIPGSAVVHVTAQEDFGVNQTLVFLVKVKSVSYLMLNLDTAMKTSGGVLPAVPVGVTLHFTVTYHDDVGETFYATNVQLGIRCSRYDRLHVSNGASNNSLVVRAAEVGQTTLKVWDRRNPWVADYISIPVQPAISPAHAVLALGSVMCFSTPLITDKGETGEWQSSSSSSSVEVDRQTGVGRAVSVGHSVLSYSVSLDVITNTEVTVVPVERIEVRPAVKYLTTHPDSSAQFVPVFFTSSAALKGNNCSSVMEQKTLRYISSVIPFLCELQLTNQQYEIHTSELFSARPVFDTASGEQGCLVQSQASPPTLQHVSTLLSSLTLSVTLPRMDGQGEIRSEGAVTLDLLPAFYVYNTELHLSNLSPLGSVRVATLAKVMEHTQVTASDPTLVEVLSPETDPQSGAVVLYPVRLRDSLTLWEREHLDLYVELANQRTGQKQRVPVIIKLVGQKPDIPRLGQYRQDVGWGYLIRSTLHNYQSWFVLLIIILATGAAVLIGYHTVIGARYKASATSNVFLNQTATSPSPSPTPHHFLQSPTSPTRGSPRPGSPPSPPRLWSVSYNQDSSFSPLKQRQGYTSFT
ncbi:hypothetical protein ACOMHN_008437 [Nucella lapillus]